MLPFGNEFIHIVTKMTTIYRGMRIISLHKAYFNQHLAVPLGVSDFILCGFFAIFRLCSISHVKSRLSYIVSHIRCWFKCKQIKCVPEGVCNHYYSWAESNRLSSLAKIALISTINGRKNFNSNPPKHQYYSYANSPLCITSTRAHIYFHSPTPLQFGFWLVCALSVAIIYCILRKIIFVGSFESICLFVFVCDKTKIGLI